MQRYYGYLVRYVSLTIKRKKNPDSYTAATELSSDQQTPTVSKYEHSNRDCYVTKSIEPVDDVMTVSSSYRYMTRKIQLISNTSWCSKTISPGTSRYWHILSRCSFSGHVRSRTSINHCSRLETLYKTINYRMLYPNTCMWHANSLPPLC
jgi:hypothetical protein